VVFTENTRLQEICQAEHLLPIRDCLISGGRFFEENGLLTLAQLQERSPTWNAKDLLYGLRRLEEPYKVCSVYGGEEDPRMAAVKLTWLPAREKKHETFVILLAGGAYGAVCTMAESLPVAARLNELGYSCFCLNYRTAVQESFVHGLMPQPLEDLAAMPMNLALTRRTTQCPAFPQGAIPQPSGGRKTWVQENTGCPSRNA